jgi:uncharacterized RDD family membrane protein YckC
MSREVQQKWIANFWRRIGALLLDSILLGVVGFILGLVLERTFVQMGGWGRLVGFGIALIYLGVMNSKLCGGQTIGKKVLKLRVVNSANQTITLGRSILRYVVFATPFSLNGAHLSTEVMFSFLMYPLALIIFGGLFSIVYLYIFNRVTRQSLHDLAVGTYVVNADVEKQAPGKVWKVHLIIVTLFFVVTAIVPVFTSKLAQTEPFQEMLKVQAAISRAPGVNYASVFTGATSSLLADEGKTATYVNSQIFLSSNNVNDVELARNLAKTIIANYPDARSKDVLSVTLTYGYDIGIASRWSYHRFEFNPAELQAVE